MRNLGSSEDPKRIEGRPGAPVLGGTARRLLYGVARTLGYDAEGHLVTVAGGTYSAAFTYDGDGKRVKSTINSVSTIFVGNYYEKAGSTITKYYYAGATRVGMRKYTIPQSMVVEYFLGDQPSTGSGHRLGSTSIPGAGEDTAVH